MIIDSPEYKKLASEINEKLCRAVSDTIKENARPHLQNSPEVFVKLSIDCVASLLTNVIGNFIEEDEDRQKLLSHLFELMSEQLVGRDKDGVSH